MLKIPGAGCQSVEGIRVQLITNFYWRNYLSCLLSSIFVFKKINDSF